MRRSTRAISGLSKNDPIAKSKDILSLLAGAGGLSYAFGFVIVNAYISSLGGSPPSLINAQVIAAGICFLLISVLLFLVFSLSGSQPFPSTVWKKAEVEKNIRIEKALRQIMAGFANMSEEFKKGFESGYRTFYTITFTTTFLASYFLSLFARQWRSSVFFIVALLPIVWLSHSSLSLFTSPWFYIWILLTSLSSNLLQDVLSPSTRSKKGIIVSLILLVVCCLILYGQNIYSTLSPSIGGGRPKQMRMLFKAGSFRMPGAMGLGLDSTGISQPVLLVTESDKTYYILTSSQSSALTAISKDSVSSVIYGSR